MKKPVYIEPEEKVVEAKTTKKDRRKVRTMQRAYEERFPGRRMDVPSNLPPDSVKTPKELIKSGMAENFYRPNVWDDQAKLDTEQNELHMALTEAKTRRKQRELERKIAKEQAELKCLTYGHDWMSRGWDNLDAEHKHGQVRCVSCGVIGEVTVVNDEVNPPGLDDIHGLE